VATLRIWIDKYESLSHTKCECKYHVVFRHSTQVRCVAAVGFIKGKSVIHLTRANGERKQNCAGQSFWARGYFVSTVGRDGRSFQEKEDQRLDQMNMWK
jgi:REP element-mobilizing transposase RayT